MVRADPDFDPHGWEVEPAVLEGFQRGDEAFFNRYSLGLSPVMDLKAL